MRIVMVCIMGVNTKQGRKDAPSRARDPQRRERGLARQEGCHIWLRGFRSCPSRPVTSQVTLGKWVNLWESWFLGCEAGVVIHRAPVRLQWDNGWLWNGFDNWKHCTNVRNYYCFFYYCCIFKNKPTSVTTSPCAPHFWARPLWHCPAIKSISWFQVSLVGPGDIDNVYADVRAKGKPRDGSLSAATVLCVSFFKLYFWKFYCTVYSLSAWNTSFHYFSDSREPQM